MTDTNGILLLNKPVDVTSFRALGSIKKSLKITNGIKVKVGHTGTLDKFAEGLLVVLTGKFTKLNQIFTSLDKSYEASIIFGTETDTLDPEGQEIKTSEIPDYSTIESAVKTFQGHLKQRPPIFSAVHVNGERAYKKALKGTLTELPERDIRIDSFEILEWKSPILRCRIDCSKGTYIRSIARDLAAACGSCGRLEKLKRISVGPFSVEDSVSADLFNPEIDLSSGRNLFKLLDSAFPTQFMTAEVIEDKIPFIKNGSALDNSYFITHPVKNGNYALFSGEEFIAYIEKNNDSYKYVFVG